MSKTDEQENTVNAARNQIVAQHNDFIRHARNQLSPQEQNIVYFLISKVRPNDIDFMTVHFTVAEFCEVCGMDSSSGKNYSDIKNALKSVADKSAWVNISDGFKRGHMLVRWIDTYTILENSGEMTATLSQSIKGFLLGLKDTGFYTQAELITFLALKSKYSKRLYEILKSYLNTREEYRYRLVIQKFEIMELKRLLSAENYGRFADFRVRVLDVSMREINEVTDIAISYTPIKPRRITTHVQFSIQLKKAYERMDARSLAENKLNGTVIIS